ncbi:GIY-YIG nuclease family protein [Halomonas piscis]|uniref:GIY-YIG nuclease family protein n=1 Tax=Halomonas piscis TaxID=3031727 RepID=UPI002899E0E4|nr:GIY-YIG nuclease family protein [Halomonas piscis]
MNSARPTSIRIFLADGVPEGLRIVEKSNWTGRAVVAGRAQLGQGLARDELNQPGIYVLTGPGAEGASRLYVGEADVLRERLRQHVAGKDFWTRFVAFTSTNEGLNKAHVRYLESRLVELAKAANQWSLDNSTAPSPPPLSEPDRADAEWFLQEMLVIFPLLGIDAFETAAGQTREAEGADSAQTLTLEQRGAKATGREVGDGFVVFEGSRARITEVASIHEYMRDLRHQLKDRDVLEVEGESLIFTQDFRFNSPSTAAGVLVGGSANGRLAWKDGQGRTLKAMQEQRAKEQP